MNQLIKTALISAIILSSTACAPAALVVGATAGGAIIYDKRSMKTMSEDQTATHYAQRWIDHDPILSKKGNVTVTVFNHVALLVGETQNTQIKQRASDIMSRIKNVQKTYNAITIAGSETHLEHASDAWLTAKVRSTLLVKGGLNSNDIKIVTEKGVVYLMGAPTHEQAALATNAARRVSGVNKVVKVFIYE